MHIPIPFSAKREADEMAFAGCEGDARYVSSPVRSVVRSNTLSVTLVNKDNSELVDSSICYVSDRSTLDSAETYSMA
jgi:hypothetical protein